MNLGPIAEFDACILEGGLPKAMDYSGLADNRINYGPVLENIVYRYARSQGCKVSVGASESWNVTSSSEPPRWATHTFRLQ